MSIICRHLLISGRVQGVCFRHFTRQTALIHKLSGWVRNLPDGRVEAVLEGDKNAVMATIIWCQKGPDLARVEEVVVTEQDVIGTFESFTIR